MALISLPNPPLVGMKENALALERGEDGDYDGVAQLEDNSRIDLTGKTLILDVFSESQRLIEKTSADVNQINVTTPAEGEFTIFFTRQDTVVLEERRSGLLAYRYNLWMVDNISGKRELLIKEAELAISSPRPNIS